MCCNYNPQNLYEYAVIRFVPSIERGEFVNIGLVMMCKRRRWIRARFADNDARLQLLDSNIDTTAIHMQIDAFGRVADGKPDAGPIALLEPHERFRWLTAVRSTCLQTSRPHPGFSENLDVTFSDLFARLVL